MVELEKLLYSPHLKTVLIFVVTKVFKRVHCSNEFMFNSHMHEILCYAMVSNKVMWWPECIQPFLPRKNSHLAA